MFKGKMARVEDANGVRLIYDGEKGRVYKLNEAQKTYESASVKEDQEEPDPLLSQIIPPKMNFDVHMTLTKTDATRTDAGRTTRRYELVASAQTKTEGEGTRPYNGGRSGRRGRRGGFPGGGFPLAEAGGQGGYPGGEVQQGPYRGNRGGPRLQFELVGELWLADTAVLPDGTKSPITALVEREMPHSPFVKACVDRLNRLKLLPLASNLTFSFTTPAAHDAVSITTLVKSITDTTMDNSLFSVPVDYHMISAH